MNELLSNGAYSNKEMLSQVNKLEKTGTPQFEIDIVLRAWDLRRELAKNMFLQLETLINDMEKFR